MPLQLKITSEHKHLLGDDCIRVFSDGGGTIGRALDNDWILPDPDRFISGRHATIDFRSGAYYLADTSTNGIYVNDEDEPLGRGNPRRLFNGDRLKMGDFQFEVGLDEGEGLDLPLAGPLPVARNHLELMVPETPLKTGIQLLDEEEITGDAAFQSTVFGSGVRQTQKMPARKPAVVKPVLARPAVPRPVERRATPIRPHRDSDTLTAEQLFEDFLSGLGIARDELHPTIEMSDVMHNAGQVMREFVAGTVELLISRANLKSMFQLDQTTVLPHHNNPLKLSENADDLLKQLLVGKEGEYLGPLDSVREVCRDLKFHHDAIIDAMTHAFRGFMDRLEPGELQEGFDRTLRRKPLIEALNRMKYWQLYCELYPIMTQPGAGPFPHIFGEEFVRAYEKHIADSKRAERNAEKGDRHLNSALAGI